MSLVIIIPSCHFHKLERQILVESHDSEDESVGRLLNSILGTRSDRIRSVRFEAVGGALHLFRVSLACVAPFLSAVVSSGDTPPWLHRHRAANSAPRFRLLQSGRSVTSTPLRRADSGIDPIHRQLLVGFSRMHLSVASACRESQISCLPCRHDASLALSAPNFALGRRDERGWQGHLEIWARLRSPISSINFQPVRCESLAGLAGAKIELPLPGTRASNNQVFACRECIGAPLLDRA